MVFFKRHLRFSTIGELKFSKEYMIFFSFLKPKFKKEKNFMLLSKAFCWRRKWNSPKSCWNLMLSRLSMLLTKAILRVKLGIWWKIFCRPKLLSLAALSFTWKGTSTGLLTSLLSSPRSTIVLKFGKVFPHLLYLIWFYQI